MAKPKRTSKSIHEQQRYGLIKFKYHPLKHRNVPSYYHKWLSGGKTVKKDLIDLQTKNIWTKKLNVREGESMTIV